MRRRGFLISVVSAAILFSPHVGFSQQTKLFKIGNLTPGPVAPRLHFYATFREGLRQLGYVEGQQYVIELRSAEGQMEKLPALAEELVRLNADVIIACCEPSIIAAKKATDRIPIVMISVADPVASGFVTSLARPGGNITGLTKLSAELSGKRLELLRELLPGITRVALLHFSANDNDEVAFQLRQLEVAAKILGIQLSDFDLHGSGEIDDAIKNAKAVADGMIVLDDPRTFSNKREIVEAAAKYGLPTIYGFREFAEAGGLLVYGPSLSHQWNRAAYYVAQIFKGAKPAEMPIEQPSKFDLIINTKTAATLGLKFPIGLLASAETTEREGEKPQRPW
jgi:putative ABC transport system substrate-binding protein